MIEKYAAKLIDLYRKNERLQNALGFYGDIDNWSSMSESDIELARRNTTYHEDGSASTGFIFTGPLRSIMDDDQGKIARKALRG